MADLEKTIIQIRETLERSYPLLLKQCGITESNDMGNSVAGFEELRSRILPIILADEKQLGAKEARKKFVQEASFTTLNRLVGLKVMEARGLIERTYVTKNIDTGGKSEAHYLYLSRNPQANSEPGQGINTVLEEIFQTLSQELPQLYNGSRYGFLPRPNDTVTVIDLINSIAQEEWLKDDIIGWIYQYYNVAERRQLKDSKAKIDQSNVHYQSQQYTPSWVVKHIVDNTLGRYYLEMYPDSPLYDEIEIPIQKEQLKREREPKKLEEIKILDPACGSGNFLLYSFELLSKMYRERDYNSDEVSSLILKNNLYGIDLDDRAAQLTILSLYLKARTLDRHKKKYTMNVVSADFHLSDSLELTAVRNKYRSDTTVQDFIDLIWSQLNDASAVGSLLDITGELERLKEKREKSDVMFFSEEAWGETEIKVLEDIKGAVSSNREYGEYIEQGMNFAELLIQKYDVVIANPPYLDSSDMTDSYKKFVKDRFKGFDKNLYAAFIKRCADFADEDGYVGMITPQTYMFISSYERTREFILERFNIQSFVHVGLGGIFERGVDVDIAIFCMKKTADRNPVVFVKLNQFSRTPQEPFKKNHMWEAIEALRTDVHSDLTYTLNQSEFKKIPGYPFVYWISDKIRELFSKYKPLKKYALVLLGMRTGNNDRFLRFWWEVRQQDISVDYKTDRKKWVPYAKGGPYNKWYGNLWWLVNWENDGDAIKFETIKQYGQNSLGWKVTNESYYFREGLTIQRVTSGIPTVRLFPSNHIFDSAVSAVFSDKISSERLMGVMLSRVFSGILQIENPTTNKQVEDVKKTPIPDLSALGSKALSPEEIRDLLGVLSSHSPLSTLNSVTLSSLAQDCIEIKKELYSFHVMERDFKLDPLSWGLKELREEGRQVRVKDALKKFFIHKAELEARLLINEAVNDELVLKLYELLPEDLTLIDVITRSGYLSSSASGTDDGGRWTDDGSSDLYAAVLEVLQSEGVPVGAYPARDLREDERKTLKKLYLKHRRDRGSGKSEAITGMEFGIVEELSGTLKVSPVTVVEELAKIDALPGEAVKDVISEHIQALTIEIMREDNDGILSLSTDTGETSIVTRIVERWRELGIGDTYNEVENLLGKRLEEYLLKSFFKDHSKRYMGRPIIWHLVSDRGSVNFFVLHHSWSYDKLLLLRSKYLGGVKRTLENTLATELDEKNREKLMERLAELERFSEALGELLDGSYLPEVDGGVAKNIAPLQKKGLLKFDVLSKKLMDKMLKVEW
ncbi:BREX-1 system adenine-specific DNA-methyltransferase PglX [Mesotoga sp.]|uniref:BREX-1 system adenine-specific DNA-methyltransferase PglX n=1 Tax=Mesotoga sp. TaxID=2053577 RepID=UPI001BD2E1EE|nr:BREX-1 system adenine-specific DNA-methyltransferase PglX [Mesotoga sp.]